jgi:hypothetical protein
MATSNPLYDPAWAPGRAPHEIGRARVGRIAIANSDAGATAYSDVAIDQVYRAVNELFPGSHGPPGGGKRRLNAEVAEHAENILVSISRTLRTLRSR